MRIMRKPLANFIKHTGRTHASIARETGLTRHQIERWLKDGHAIYVWFDKRSAVINRIVEEPSPKLHYQRGKK